MNHHIDGILVNNILITSMKEKYVTEFVILKQMEIKKKFEIKTVYLTGHILFSIHLIYLIKNIYTQ